jgi:hypothetical protein
MAAKGSWKEFCIRGHARTRESVDPKSGSCKVCRRLFTKRWEQTEEGRKRRCEQQRAFAKRNPKSIFATKLKGIYGMTIEDFETKRAEQGNKCPICTITFTEEEKPVVDHCHRPGGKVRSLLCRRCNSGIGLLRDDPEIIFSAALYVEGHLSKKTQLTQVA